MNYINLTTNPPRTHEHIQCRNLKRFVRFVRFVFEKNIFAYELYYVDH